MLRRKYFERASRCPFGINEHRFASYDASGGHSVQFAAVSPARRRTSRGLPNESGAAFLLNYFLSGRSVTALPAAPGSGVFAPPAVSPSNNWFRFGYP